MRFKNPPTSFFSLLLKKLAFTLRHSGIIQILSAIIRAEARLRIAARAEPLPIRKGRERDGLIDQLIDSSIAIFIKGIKTKQHFTFEPWQLNQHSAKLKTELRRGKKKIKKIQSAPAAAAPGANVNPSFDRQTERKSCSARLRAWWSDNIFHVKCTAEAGERLCPTRESRDAAVIMCQILWQPQITTTR